MKARGIWLFPDVQTACRSLASADILSGAWVDNELYIHDKIETLVTPPPPPPPAATAGGGDGGRSKNKQGLNSNLRGETLPTTSRF